MAIWKDFISGGLPAVLDTPEKATTANDADGGYKSMPSYPEYSERYEPASPGAGSAYTMPTFANVPGGGWTVAGVALFATLTVVVLATRG